VQTQRITGLTYDSCYLCVKNGQLLATGRWFSPGTPVSSTNKTDHHYITDILLKVALDTITQPHTQKWSSNLDLVNTIISLYREKGDYSLTPWPNLYLSYWREITNIFWNVRKNMDVNEYESIQHFNTN
jgi:hypothetical protein